MYQPFKIVTDFAPAGDQPGAIQTLVDGLNDGLAHQMLLGVTGSGKTFTIANVIEQVQRPTIILAPNKTLAAQLYGEMKEFFPQHAVEYFVSYYDYYQPEAYVPSSDTFIEKDASINEHIEQMRLSATKALFERPDTVIVATVSAIYGLGDPKAYLNMVMHLDRGDRIDQRKLLRRLAELQYTRNDTELRRGTFRVRGEVIDVYPADSEREGIRIELFDDEIEHLSFFDPLTGEITHRVPRLTIYPKTHYVTPREVLLNAIEQIREELEQHLEVLKRANRLVEAQRLEQRTRFDLEMIQEIGYCAGIENYSRYLSGRAAGEPPALPAGLPAGQCPNGDGREPCVRTTVRGYVPRRSITQGNPGRVWLSSAFGPGQPPAAVQGVRFTGSADDLCLGYTRTLRDAKIRCHRRAGRATHGTGGPRN